MHYLISLALTLLVEGIYAPVWGIRRKDLLLVLLANVLTNPLVVLVHNLLLSHSFLLHTLFPELWAVGTEAAIYCFKKNNISSPALFAVSANVLSYALGLLLQAIL